MLAHPGAYIFCISPDNLAEVLEPNLVTQFTVVLAIELASLLEIQLTEELA